MNEQVTTQDLFELIGRQTVEIERLRRQLDQMSVMIQQLQGEKEKAAQENGSQTVAEGIRKD